MTEAEIRWRLWVNEPANAQWYTQQTGRPAPPTLSPKARFDLWYKLPENSSWYHQQPGTPPPAATQPGTTGQTPDGRAAEGRESARAILRGVLSDYGLEALDDWAWSQIQDDRSVEEVLLDLRQQETFKERFKAIGIREANGLTPVSPQQIVDYEAAARDLMRASGLPSGFYDQPDDFAELIGKGVSLPSLQDRVEQTWNRVVDAPAEVRQAFGDFYGAVGDQALAAFIFDPDKGEAQLSRMARAAVAGGAMQAFGFGSDQAAADRIASLNVQDPMVRQGFAQLARISGVFTESIGEREDLDAMTEGVNAVFDAGEGEAAIQDRITARQNAFAGGGGSFLTQQGLAGVADA